MLTTEGALRLTASAKLRGAPPSAEAAVAIDVDGANPSEARSASTQPGRNIKIAIAIANPSATKLETLGVDRRALLIFGKKEEFWRERYTGSQPFSVLNVRGKPGKGWEVRCSPCRSWHVVFPDSGKRQPSSVCGIHFGMLPASVVRLVCVQLNYGASSPLFIGPPGLLTSKLGQR
ncbi:MAG: hypothetical protein ACT4NL_00925 [Pseudomarimonas sp.]